MENLARAFARCASQYDRCPVYQELQRHEHLSGRNETVVLVAAAS